MWKPIADVICWQECSNAEVRDSLRAALPAPWGHVTFNDLDLGPGMNSISFRADKFRLVAKGHRRASEPRTNVSPARYACWVILEHIATGTEFAVINCHFVSKAFFNPPASDSEWRQLQWMSNRTVLREVVGELSTRYPVLVGADVNRQLWDCLSRNLVEPRYVEAPKGPTVDRIAVTKDVTVLDSRLGPKNGSDHYAVHARVRLPKERS